jgi:xylulokinase
MARFAGIDVGSSFIKAALLDLDTLQLRRVERAPFPGFVQGLEPLHREVDPAKAMRAVEDVLARVLAGESRCDGVVLCGQMHGFVLVDGRGEAISNYISWLDQRVTPEEFEEMSGAVTEQDRAEIGNEFRSSIALPLLASLRRRGALPDGATPVSLADFVAGRLCGALPAMEATQAAAFGGLRLGTLGWHEGVIGKLGLDSLRWPEVRPQGSIVGAWQDAPCYTAVGDQQCALAGALLAGRELSVNIGTGSQVGMLADAAGPGGLQTRPYFDGRMLRTITHIPGGRALSALVGLFAEIGGTGEEEAWRHVESALASVASTDIRAGAAFFPGACGYGGFLEHLHEGNMTVGHVFRAVFESMARNYAACAQRLDPDREAARVVFSGGVARRWATLRDLTESALGLPSRLSPHDEDTLFGLMALALAFREQSGVRTATETISQFLSRYT